MKLILLSLLNFFEHLWLPYKLLLHQLYLLKKWQNGIKFHLNQKGWKKKFIVKFFKFFSFIPFFFFLSNFLILFSLLVSHYVAPTQMRVSSVLYNSFLSFFIYFLWNFLQFIEKNGFKWDLIKTFRQMKF